MGAKKNDNGKRDLSLIPMIALTKEAEAFEVGLRKYSRYNYCEGMEASRLISALMRHATAWFEGEEIDPVDGQHHLGSVRACAAMILRMQELGTLVDNRYTKPDPVIAEAKLEWVPTREFKVGDKVQTTDGFCYGESLVGEITGTNSKMFGGDYPITVQFSSGVRSFTTNYTSDGRRLKSGGIALEHV